jgi:hypothetical protein
VEPSSAVDRTINDMNQQRSDVFMIARVQSTAAALEAVAKHLAGLPGAEEPDLGFGELPNEPRIFSKAFAWNQSCQGFLQL